MRTTGIIVEYNPFHEGHIYHIHKAKEITQCDCLVAVTSGCFTQRGLPSLLSKYDKTWLALQNGVNLVLELPVCYTAQSADRFAKYAVSSLAQLKIDNLCFGSETNDLTYLETYAKNLDSMEIHPSRSQLKNTFDVLGELSPNDILGVCYIRSCRRYGIQPVCIRRNPDFKSATKTREDYFHGQRQAFDVYFHPEQKWDHYYPYLRTFLLLTPAEQLSKYHLVTEGIENRLKECAKVNDTWAGFIQHAISKTYTASRIQRTCLMICLQITKEEMMENAEYSTVKVLGFDSVGKQLLHDNKGADIVSRYQDLSPFLQNIDRKTNAFYNSVMKEIIKEEKVILYDR